MSFFLIYCTKALKGCFDIKNHRLLSWLMTLLLLCALLPAGVSFFRAVAHGAYARRRAHTGGGLS